MFLDTLVSLIYGRHYSPSSEFRTMVAILSFLRFCRTGPTAVLLVSGGTGRLAGANLVAGTGVLIGYTLGVLTHDLLAVLGGMIVGELLCSSFMYYQIRRYLQGSTIVAHGFILLVPLCVACGVTLSDDNLGFVFRVLVFMLAAIFVTIDIGIGYWWHFARAALGRN